MFTNVRIMVITGVSVMVVTIIIIAISIATIASINTIVIIVVPVLLLVAKQHIPSRQIIANLPDTLQKMEQILCWWT